METRATFQSPLTDPALQSDDSGDEKEDLEGDEVDHEDGKG